MPKLQYVDDRISPFPSFIVFLKAFYDIFSILINLIIPILKIQTGQFLNLTIGSPLVRFPPNHLKVVLSQFSIEIGMFSISN